LTGNPPAILLGGGVTAVPVARSLGRAGVPVTALGKRDDPVRASRYTREWVELGRGEGAQERWLEWLSGAPRGAVVLPCEDNGLELVGRHRATLLELGLVPIEADDDVLLAMLDKNRTSALAERHGIPAPRTLPVSTREDLDRAVEALGFPVALKPVNSHMFARHFVFKVFVAEDRAALHTAFDRTQAVGLEMLLTEIIPGPDSGLEAWCGYLAEDGDSLFQVTKRKPRQFPVRFGNGTFHVTDWLPEAARLGYEFMRSVGGRGLAQVEFKRDMRDGSLKLIECNHRFTANTEMWVAAGVDTPLFTYNRLVGRPLPPMTQPRGHVKLWFPIEDFRAAEYYRSQGEITWPRWLRTLRPPLRFPYASLRDPGPSLVSTGPRLWQALTKRLRRVVNR
jgi:D-aspartate ligase